jgi:threonine dehydrogenase-like Zn-dependent dehydrogenase
MTIPQKMLAWPLFGAGMENFGKNNQPCVAPVPAIKADELLVRIDAVGLCFSDVKLIRAGQDHPRVVSPNLATDPVIPGHEAVMTVVQVGAALKGRFAVGQRYIIQADIYVQGKNFAYGYAIDGGMALYSRMDQRILAGDEGCYLLPLADNIPAGIAALVEPWTCVLVSYMIKHRTAPKTGGEILIAGGSAAAVPEPGELLCQARPAAVRLFGFQPEQVKELKSKLSGLKIEVLNELPAARSFDDIFLCGVTDRPLAEKISKLGRKDAIISFIGDYPDEAWSFDVGNIHYQGWFYQGTTTNNLSAAYGRNVRSKLRKGGTCWLLGGAGAMGQMHTQLAVEAEDGPARILVTDMDEARIANLHKLLGAKIAARGVEFKTLNPKNFRANAEFEAAVADFARPAGGFDDIVMLVPVVPVMNAAVPFLGQDGLMNIFAGIPAGKEGSLKVRDIVTKGARFIGSSGSRTDDLRHTLELVETGRLNPATALAAIGGMKDLKKGLEGVAEAKFPGKTVIFPHCLDLPLTPVEKLSELAPDLVATLSPDGLYTMATEKALFRRFLKE